MYPGTASGQLAWTTPITAGRLAKFSGTLQFSVTLQKDDLIDQIN